MEKAHAILLKEFPQKDWQIHKPGYGRQKECYVATSTTRRMFIKFGVSAPILRRLGDICVAPRLLANGEYQGESYVIQEYIEGEHPNRSWLYDHFAETAQLMKRYHEDSPLTELVGDTEVVHYRRYIEADLNNLAQRIRFCHQTPKMQKLFTRFQGLSEMLEEARLVPIHNEPNTTNMLVSGPKLVFIDWDEILLADPMRDIGNFLWWYAPRNTWEDFARTAGVEPIEYSEQKVYWFAARASLVIYLWQVEHGHSGDEFFKDFLAALNMQTNPRA